ncbi:MAG: L,D-transpeptidase family protein [Lachnospiraceae bacterium]|nr:L,D-transpeptidase family protein [Lachnospiraceae bacterium]
MKKTLKTGAVMALIAALAVPVTAYADNGYENHGPGIALEQQGQGAPGTVNMDSGSENGPGAPGESTAEDGGDAGITGVITPGQKEFNGVTLNYGVGNGGFYSNMSLVFNSGLGGSISYTSSINNGGWLGWNYVGELNGAVDGNPDTRMEAIRIGLSMLAGYNWDIYYRVTLDTIGQLGWAKNGEIAGTLGSGHYITDIDIQLVPKGQPGPESDRYRFYSPYESRMWRDEAGAIHYDDPNGNDYSGWLDDAESRFFVSNSMVLTGWQYLNGYKYYFREDGRLVQNVDPIIGKQSSYIIKVNKTTNCLTIYAKDGENGYILPVMSMLTSVGDDTPLGTFKSPERYRWRYMIGDCYTQYATRITGSFLLHSVIFEKENNRTLRAQTYNDLGVARSAGCVRLRTADAKWIYDNVQAGVPITIYEDTTSVGPFYRPDVVPVPNTQEWDPTDPGVLLQ